MNKKPLPVGIDDFEKLITGDYLRNIDYLI